eukprot:7577615-Alexandrium_andersonii.AAC.1
MPPPDHRGGGRHLPLWASSPRRLPPRAQGPPRTSGRLPMLWTRVRRHGPSGRRTRGATHTNA